MTLLVKTRSLKTYSWNMSNGASWPASATRSKEMLPFADCTCSIEPVVSLSPSAASVMAIAV